MENIHDLAREFLATEGIKMSDTQSRAVFLFADWVLANSAAGKLKSRHNENLERIAYLESLESRPTKHAPDRMESGEKI